MNKNILNAKNELYHQLKGLRGITGAGIRGKGASGYIVIFVQNLTERLRSRIPAEFRGIAVRTEKAPLPGRL